MSGPAPIHGRAPAASEPDVSALYRASSAAEYGLLQQDFARILAEIGAKYLPSAASPRERLEFYRGLRLEELALARGCAAGNEYAWEVFLTRYREKLYDAARAITREDTTSRELADSLYADLYGADLRDGVRRSKLNYYTGRGSLEGWLRATMAQEYVNRYRRQQRLVSLEEKTGDGVQFAAPAAEPAQAADPRLVETTDAALAALPAEESFILASYYLDGCTLAEVARTLGVHESTISRKLEKIARALRLKIMDGLVQRGMSRRQAEEALETDVRDLPVDVSARLAQKTAGTTFLKKEPDS